MSSFNTAGWILVGIVLIILGFILKSGIVEFLLDIMGWLLIIVGIVALVLGVGGMIFGRRSRSGGF